MIRTINNNIDYTVKIYSYIERTNLYGKSVTRGERDGRGDRRDSSTNTKIIHKVIKRGF